MSRIFVKKEELVLKNGGYVVTGKEEIPVYHKDFVEAQKHAEWVVTFAEKTKGKDFIGKAPDTIESVKRETELALADRGIKYITAPPAPKQELTNKLQAEALSFMTTTTKRVQVEKINDFLQAFNTIQEFEEFGLYFKEEVCKLNKIYTIKEIAKAAELIIDLLD